MTITAPAAPQSDAKAGYCARCRNGQHYMCASPEGRCSCPFKEHPSRPSPSPLDDVRSRAQASAVASPLAPASTTPAPAPALAICGHCRNGVHARCRSVMCPCEGPAHPNRPGATPARPGRPAGTSTKAKVEPVWELVKDAPPAPPPKPRKPTPAELVQPMLETIVEADDRDSWRVGVFGSAIAASKARKALAASMPDEWEWTSTRDREGRPALFVRWLGPKDGEE